MFILLFSSVYRMGSYRSKTESRNMEYKTGSGSYVWNTLPEHIQKYGSAFLNSGGGTLCIGVADSGGYGVLGLQVLVCETF